jgi:hypothetical protein
MTIYSKQEPDLSNPAVCAVCYQEWITQCCREIPFTQFLPNGQLGFIFNRSQLPRLSGLYAVTAALFPHQLDLELIHQQGKLLKISDRLPAWVDEQKRSQRFVHLLYVGATDNLATRLAHHEKLIDLRAFQQQGVEMKLYFHASPPALKLDDSHLSQTEKTLIDSLAPLLNFH